MPDSSILEREIRQQPDVLARLLDNPVIPDVAEAIRKADPAYIVIAARGTSDNAARYAQYLFGIRTGLNVALAAPSISTIYEHPPRYRNTVVIGVSQSGKSVDVAQVVADAAAQGVLTITITNDPESVMAKSAQYHIDLGAGEERAVAASKTYTAQLAALAIIVAHLSGDKTMRADLKRLPELAQQTISTLWPTIQERAERFRFMTRCVTLGRGYNYATAFEIALKLTELTYVTAEPYSSADFRHGPKAMVEPDFPVIAIAPSGAVYADMKALIDDMAERGADLTVISNEGDALARAQLPLRLPAMPEWISPVAAVLPGQLIAMATAAAKGHELDRPRGLTKVTITR